MSAREGIGKVYREKLAKVVNTAKGGITPDHVVNILKVDQQEAGRLLARWERSGWVRRIKRGFYISVPVEAAQENLSIENPWALVSKIFSPGYIAGFSAIKHWNLSEQIFETVVFYTSKKIKERQPKYADIQLKLKSINKEKLFGTKTVWIDSVKVQVSDPTKTIVDLLDDPAFGGGMRAVQDFFSAYMESEHRNIPLLLEYAEKMHNDTIFKRLGFLLEISQKADDRTLEFIRSKISKGYSKFDPAIASDRFLRRWNLKIPNSWAKDYDREK